MSDLAASGARPEALVVTLGAPPETTLEDVIELYEGIAEAGVPVVGGDTTRADRLFLSVTALGHSERVPGRGGARPGDRLVVTGELGASGAAFRRSRFARPPLRVEEGVLLARTATAMLDVSDGLAVDAAHLATRSGCRVEIELERVPLAPERRSTTSASARTTSCWRRSRTTPRSPFAEIGRCVEGEGVAFTLDGEPYDLRGWDHYSAP